jgi:hypothetical protein
MWNTIASFQRSYEWMNHDKLIIPIKLAINSRGVRVNANIQFLLVSISNLLAFPRYRTLHSQPVSQYCTVCFSNSSAAVSNVVTDLIQKRQPVFESATTSCDQHLGGVRPLSAPPTLQPGQAHVRGECHYSRADTPGQRIRKWCGGCDTSFMLKFSVAIEKVGLDWDGTVRNG